MMNDDLIKQCAREGAAKAWEDCKDIPPAASKSLAQQARSGDLDDFEAVQAARNAIRLYHARHVAPLVEALREITEGAQTTYRARNGRQCIIEADDGELCLIVHSDLIDNGKQALAPFQQEAK